MTPTNTILENSGPEAVRQFVGGHKLENDRRRPADRHLALLPAADRSKVRDTQHCGQLRLGEAVALADGGDFSRGQLHPLLNGKTAPKGGLKFWGSFPEEVAAILGEHVLEIGEDRGGDFSGGHVRFRRSIASASRKSPRYGARASSASSRAIRCGVVMAASRASARRSAGVRGSNIGGFPMGFVGDPKLGVVSEEPIVIFAARKGVAGGFVAKDRDCCDLDVVASATAGRDQLGEAGKPVEVTDVLGRLTCTADIPDKHSTFPLARWGTAPFDEYWIGHDALCVNVFLRPNAKYFGLTNTPTGEEG